MSDITKPKRLLNVPWHADDVTAEADDSPIQIEI